MYPKDPAQFVCHCKSLSYEELQDLILELEAAVTGTDNALLTAPHSIPTNQARRWHKWRLTTARSVAKRRAVATQPLAATFMDTARSLLPPETFQMLLNEAKAISNGAS